MRFSTFIKLILVGFIILLLGLSFIGNINQIYTDYVIHYCDLPNWGGNKTGEIYVFYLVLITGILYLFWYKNKYNSMNDDKSKKEIDKNDITKWTIIIISIISIGVWNNISPIVITLLFLLCIVNMLKSLGYKEIFISFVCTYYGISGLDRLILFLGGKKELNEYIVAILSLVVIVCIVTFSKNILNNIKRNIMFWQMFIPSTLFIIIMNKYLYHNEIITIDIPIASKIFVIFFVTIFTLENICKIKKYWHSWNVDISSYISVGSCISIVEFNSFFGTGNIMWGDLHHPFENVIGYHQVFEMKQSLFTQYIPVSGLYSVVEGAFFYYFGNGLFSFYFLSSNIMYFCIICLIIYLLSRNINKFWLLIISICLPVSLLGSAYNRIILTLPIMLLFIDKKLIENKIRWIQLYIICNFFHMLYYPTYGVAVAVAFMPLAVYQLLYIYKNRTVHSEISKFKFWISSGIILSLMTILFPLLIDLYNHISNMVSQSIVADGIARFGQKVPEMFLSWLLIEDIRLIAWYFCSMMAFIVFTWIAFKILLDNIYVNNYRVICVDLKSVCILLSIFIMPLIVYKFQILRYWPYNMYGVAGTNVIVYPACILMAIILSKTIKCIDKSKMLLMMVMIALLTGDIGFINNNEKFQSHYNVPDDFIYTADSNIKKLGDGFINKRSYNQLCYYYDIYEKRPKDIGGFNVYPSFGYYYLFDIKGVATIEPLTIRDYKSSSEIKGVLESNHVPIGMFLEWYEANNREILPAYYLYNWVVTSGKYIWNENLQWFEYNDNIEPKDAIAMNAKTNMGIDNIYVKHIFSNLGNSYDTLKNIFHNMSNDISCQEYGVCKFSVLTSGENADFIYLELADFDKNYTYGLYDDVSDTKSNIKLKFLTRKYYNLGDDFIIEWENDDNTKTTIRGAVDNGKLLVPLGAGKGWLLHAHDNIKIKIIKNNGEIVYPTINKALLLRLRKL